MAVTSDTLQIVIKLRDQATRGLRTLGKTLGTMRQRVSNLIPKWTGLHTAITSAMASITAGVLARSFIQAADAAEGYRVRLSVLLGSQKEANALFKDMADYASGVSFEYEEIMEAATSLSGVLLGGREEVKKWMPVLSDLAAASGLTMEETTRNFIMMYSSGAAAADSFRNKGILAMLGFKAKTQYTAQETRKILMKAWEDPASRFRDASLKLASTWSGLTSMMADRWFQFRVMVMEDGGLLDYMKAIVQTYLNYMGKLQKEGKLDEWAKHMADEVINAFETILLGAASFYDAIRPVVHGLKVVVGSIFDVWNEMPAWMQEVGVVVAIFGGKKVAIAIASLTHLYNAIKNMAKGAGMVAGGALKFSDFADMNFEELDKFIKKFDEQYERTVKEELDVANKAGAEQVDGLRSKIEGFLAEVHRLRDKLKADREAADKEGGGPRPTPAEEVDTKVVQARLDAETKMVLESNRTMLAAIEGQWSEHTITMQDYFKERVRLANEAYEAQRKALEKEAELEKADPAKTAAIKAQLHALDEEYMRTMLQIQLDLNQAVKDEAQARKDATDIIAGIDQRLAQSRAAGGGLSEQFKLEQEALRRQQEDDIQRLLDLKEKGYVAEEEIQAAKNKHLLEQEQLAANQRKQLWQTYVDSIQSTLGDMTSMFNDWYQAAGSKHKELFNLYKAASIAETIIATYSSAQKAYDAMAKIPYIGPALAASAAAIAVAAGLARVQLIRQQQMATGGVVMDKGGKIPGVSATPTSDNIPIAATAGEFMQPVSAVRYYGVRAMEAIRKKLVPRELLLQFAAKVPNIRINATHQYATGGAIAAAAASGGGDTNLSMPVSVRLPEQLGFIGRRLEAEIEPVILRVLQEELRY